MTSQFRDVGVHPRILPDQRVVHRPPRLTIPYDCGLALIGDSNGGEIGCAQASLLQRFVDDVLRPPPDFVRVVLHPSGLRVNLFVLLLRNRNDSSVAVENNKARAGRSLIDGANVIRHFLSRWELPAAFRGDYSIHAAVAPSRE